MLCSGCNYEVSKIDGMVALDKNWHKSCFKCGATGREGCGKILIPSPNQYTIYQNIPYCNPCYNSTFKEVVHKEEEPITSLSKQSSFSQSSNKIRSGGSMGLVAMLNSRGSSISGNIGNSNFINNTNQDIPPENINTNIPSVTSSTTTSPTTPSVKPDKVGQEKNESSFRISNIPDATNPTYPSNNDIPVVDKFNHLNLKQAKPVVPTTSSSTVSGLPPTPNSSKSSSITPSKPTNPSKPINTQNINITKTEQASFTTTPLKPADASAPSPPIPPLANPSQQVSTMKEITTATITTPSSNKNIIDKHPSLHYVGSGDEVDESEW